MSKNLKEFMLRQTTGQVDLEFDDDSTQSYNMKDVVTATSDPAAGGLQISRLACAMRSMILESIRSARSLPLLSWPRHRLAHRELKMRTARS